MKAAIIFYSFSGNTERAALYLQEELSSKGIAVNSLELMPKTEERSFLKQSKQALFKQRVDLNEVQYDLAEYDYVVFASPVWAFTFAPALRSYLDKVEGLKDKKTICFLTYGSGAGSARALRELEGILGKKQADIIFSINLSGFKARNNEYLKKSFGALLKIINL